MKNPDGLQQAYEELAGRFEQLAEPRRRDHCLVLAADAALSAGRAEDAEWLRQRLLRVNPYHLLRPYASMSEALESGDVRDYITDLRHQLPPDRVAQLLKGQPHAEEPVYKVVHESAPPTPHELTPLPEIPRPALRTVVPPPPPPPPRKPAPAPTAPAPTRLTASPTAADVAGAPRQPQDPPAAVGHWVATFLFALALVLSGAMFFLAFIRPFFE